MIRRAVAVYQIPVRRLLSRSEAAEYLGMSRATLDRRVRDGVIPAVRDGGKVKFRLDDLDRYVEALRVYSAAGGEHGNPHVDARRKAAAVFVEDLAGRQAFPAADAGPRDGQETGRADYDRDHAGRLAAVARRAGRTARRSDRG